VRQQGQAHRFLTRSPARRAAAAPNGLCNLETGPETFSLSPQRRTGRAAEGFLSARKISVKVDEIACAQDAGQMSEAVITKWSV